MSEVWIIEQGDYEQRCVMGVADSINAAELFVKKLYGKPYIVEWEPLVISKDGTGFLTGHFSAVNGYSTKHTDTVGFTKFDVFSDAISREKST